MLSGVEVRLLSGVEARLLSGAEARLCFTPFRKCSDSRSEEAFFHNPRFSPGNNES
ncbi:MAG TPA: hypothetical protein VF191_06555 [Cyclobacteriaceae bacterium]